MRDLIDMVNFFTQSVRFMVHKHCFPGMSSYSVAYLHHSAAYMHHLPGVSGYGVAYLQYPPGISG